MTKKDIIARALELYPKEYPLMENEVARKAYIKGVLDVLNGKTAWALWEAGKLVNTELYGDTTSTKYFGEKMIEKIKNPFER